MNCLGVCHFCLGRQLFSIPRDSPSSRGCATAWDEKCFPSHATLHRPKQCGPATAASIPRELNARTPFGGSIARSSARFAVVERRAPWQSGPLRRLRSAGSRVEETGDEGHHLPHCVDDQADRRRGDEGGEREWRSGVGQADDDAAAFWIDPTNDTIVVGMMQNLNGSSPTAGSPQVRPLSRKLVYAALVDPKK